MDPPFEAVEAQIEGMWREILGKDLKLYPLNPVRCSCTLSSKS